MATETCESHGRIRCSECIYVGELEARLKELEIESIRKLRRINGMYDEMKKENARLRSEQSTVHIIKRRNGKPTVIGWNGERYVYQSDSSARGGKGRKSSG